MFSYNRNAADLRYFAEVLSSLQNRFDIDKIYTFTGPILIAWDAKQGLEHDKKKVRSGDW